MASCHLSQSHRTLFFLVFFFSCGCSTGPVLRSAVLEDCVLCQEAISSSEVAAKAREGQFEGQITHKHPPPPPPRDRLMEDRMKRDGMMAGDRSRWLLTVLLVLSVDPPDWVPDEACNSCIACKAPFTVIRRKHHCRSCGKVRVPDPRVRTDCPHLSIYVVADHVCTLFSDLLLALLLSFCSFAQIWSDEACQGLHALLHVSRHTLLQRQGRHLTALR